MRFVDALLFGLLFLALAGCLLMPVPAYLGRKIGLARLAIAGTLLAVLRDEPVKWLLEPAVAVLRTAE